MGLGGEIYGDEVDASLVEQLEEVQSQSTVNGSSLGARITNYEHVEDESLFIAQKM